MVCNSSVALGEADDALTELLKFRVAYLPSAQRRQMLIMSALFYPNSFHCSQSSEQTVSMQRSLAVCLLLCPAHVLFQTA